MLFLGYPLLLFILMNPLLSSATTDTITPTQPLTDNGDPLVSKHSKFALGFFSPRNSTQRYIGVWYNTIPEQTVVWVLNRDNPINDSTGVLSVDTTGNLLLHRGNTLVWSSNLSNISSATPVAQLLDTGNLVLIHNDDDKRVVVWEGFDHPTDNLLPDMRIGLNRRTGLNWFLTSWKSQTDPGTGAYSLRLTTSEVPQSFLYRGSQPISRTGHWNGARFSGVPTMKYANIYKLTFVNDRDQVSFMLTELNSSELSRISVDPDGYTQRIVWKESQRKWLTLATGPTLRCDYYSRCGPNTICDEKNEFECTCLPGFEPKSPNDWSLKNGSAGCVRKEGAKVCGNTREGFVKVEDTKPPDTSSARVNMNMNSLQACGEECLKDCSCTAYATANVSGSGSGCLSWYGDLVDTTIFHEGGQDFYLRVDAITLAGTQKQSKGFLEKKGMKAGLVAGAAVVVMVLLVSSFLFLRKKMKLGRGSERKMLFDFGGKEHDESSTNSELKFYDLNTIAAATNDFSSHNELGHGGFGSVYKGRLSSGQEIAVKRLSKHSGQGKLEFRNEVTLIAKLQHRNLVRLFGCSIQEDEKILVYEYLPNKSLDSFIFDERNKPLLDWNKRFEIIVGIARGILYLHQDSRLKIIHRDLKAGNVLLDAEMLPKISDFGMAKIFGGNQMEGNTNRVVGTYGYMSPEYAMEGLFSTKSDVYSFGVLVLEIITGRRNNIYYQDCPYINLVGHVWNLWEEGKALDVIDPSLEKPHPAGEVLRCIQIGLLCVEEKARDRPSMSTIISMLGNDSTLPLPKHPAFTSKTSSLQGENLLSFGGRPVLSVNEVTVTMLQPR